MVGCAAILIVRLAAKLRLIGTLAQPLLFAHFALTRRGTLSGHVTAQRGGDARLVISLEPQAQPSWCAAEEPNSFLARYALSPLTPVEIVPVQIQGHLYLHLITCSTSAAAAHPLVQLDIRATNPDLGWLHHFSADEAGLVWLAAANLLVQLFILIPLQISHVCTMWAWPNAAPLALAILITLMLECSASLLQCAEDTRFALSGLIDLDAVRLPRLAVAALRLAASLAFLGVVLSLSRGWTLGDARLAPQRAWPWLCVLGVLAGGWLLSAMSRAVVPIDTTWVDLSLVPLGDVQASLELVMFVVAYGDLVRLMRRSRLFPGAKVRGRVFSSCATLLFVWLLLPLAQNATAWLVGDTERPLWRAGVAAAGRAACLWLLIHTCRPRTMFDLTGGGGPEQRERDEDEFFLL